MEGCGAHYSKKKGDDTMSAVARDYAFIVKAPDKSKQVPVISKSRIEQAKKNVAPLTEKRHGIKT